MDAPLPAFGVGQVSLWAIYDLLADYTDHKHPALTTHLRTLFCRLEVKGPLMVFVANPSKTQPIVDILLKNQAKLIDFLSTFQKERTDDEQFSDEKNYLIKQIRDLKKPTA